MISNPHVTAAERHGTPHLGAGAGALQEARDAPAAIPTQRRRSALGMYAVLGATAAVVAYRLLVSAFATPLDTATSGAAPAWMVEVTTTGTETGTALAYGRDVGFQLLRVPAGQGSTNDARIVPARLARGELHLVSLGWTSLRVHASSPKGAFPMSFSATSPIITAYQTREGTGVRTGW